MRWSIIRLIALREVRDLLRDRRTLFLVFGLPVILYPVFAVIGLWFAQSMLDAEIRVGVVGAEHLPALSEPDTPPVAALVGGAAVARAELTVYPPLVLEGRFVHESARTDIEFGRQREFGGELKITPLTDDDRGPLERREVDVILVVPRGFADDLARGRKPTLRLLGRDGDETSKLAVRKVASVLEDWKLRAKAVRFASRNLPADFDQPVVITDPMSEKQPLRRTVDELRDALVKMLPFLVVMWAMAGALHPAIDMTAGEKERGTMETLLISPAERIEIVGGKFLATLGFSYFTAVWNILWMGGGALALSLLINTIVPMGEVISFAGLAWAVLFALPLAALFSAVSLALGIYARGTKEGQYYLIPLFLFTMPLTFWSLAPGVRLDGTTSLIPVTGMALLLQELMSVSPSPGVAWYSIPVMGVLLACVAVALFWAVRQFHNETVLFRESEQDIFAWLRRKVKPK